ncbi:MAG: hypothetical protein P4L40_21050 [Terracidiphilus sp.]|nr:hypothetical protein [Terracidiphilus sp.]
MLRRATVVLLAFLGLSAIAGAVPMIVSALRGTPGYLPLSLLEHSPFHSYLVPGILLLVANGLLALWTLAQLLRCARHAAAWVAVQGAVLLGWLAVECVMLRMVMWLHWFYGAIGVLLVVAGLALRRDKAQS